MASIAYGVHVGTAGKSSQIDGLERGIICGGAHPFLFLTLRQGSAQLQDSCSPIIHMTCGESRLIIHQPSCCKPKITCQYQLRLKFTDREGDAAKTKLQLFPKSRQHMAHARGTCCTAVWIGPHLKYAPYVVNPALPVAGLPTSDLRIYYTHNLTYPHC